MSLLDGQGDSSGKEFDLLQGRVDRLIGKAAGLGSSHGYGVLLRINKELKAKFCRLTAAVVNSSQRPRSGTARPSLIAGLLPAPSEEI